MSRSVPRTLEEAAKKRPELFAGPWVPPDRQRLEALERFAILAHFAGDYTPVIDARLEEAYRAEREWAAHA